MGGSNSIVPLALIGFFPFALVCFIVLKPRRAVLVSLFVGWLFLPVFESGYDFPLLHHKAMFVSAVVVLASVLFDGGRWLAFRPRLIDLPMALVCFSPFFSSLANGLGPYDGGSAVFDSSMTWGAPYLLGRLYFSEPEAVRDLALATASAALAYVPFCLWEIRMSPTLHAMVYGLQPFGFGQAIRFGGYRPSVFMTHGLMLGMLMACGTLVAVWTWRTGARTELWGVPMGWVCAVLVVTTLLTKSTGAIALLLIGLIILEAAKRLHSSVPILFLLAVPPMYCAARVQGWTGKPLVYLSQEVVNEERAASLDFRIVNEDLLIVKALQRPWLGWGRWGRARVYDESGKDISVTDGLWILALGSTGLVGLASLLVALALPGLLVVRLSSGRHWGHLWLAPAAALAVVGALGAVDDVLNAMVSPVFPAIAGSLGGLYWAVRTARRRRVLLGRPRVLRFAGVARYRPRWALVNARGTIRGRRPRFRRE